VANIFLSLTALPVQFGFHLVDGVHFRVELFELRMFGLHLQLPVLAHAL
jgi:hypothetical protein